MFPAVRTFSRWRSWNGGADLAQLENLRPRAARLLRLLEKADDGETGLGSDVMSAALEGSAMLKVSGTPKSGFRPTFPPYARWLP